MLRKVLFSSVLIIGIVLIAITLLKLHGSMLEIAVFGSFSSDRFLSHKNTYYDALHIYRLKHPDSKLKILEVDISYKASEEEIREKLEKLHKKGIDVVIAPYPSPLTSVMGKIAAEYDMIVLAPFSRYVEFSKNLIPLIPQLKDFASVAVDFIRSRKFKRILISTRSEYTVDKKIVEDLTDMLKDEEVEVEIKDEIESSDIARYDLLLIVKSFPTYFSRDLRCILEDGNTPVLFVITYIDHFQYFYGPMLKGMYVVDHAFYHTEKGKGFVRDYMERFGEFPSPGVVAMYDALGLAETLFEKFDEPKIEDVRSMRFYDGVMGRIPLEDGNTSDLLTISIFRSLKGKCERIPVREW